MRKFGSPERSVSRLRQILFRNFSHIKRLPSRWNAMRPVKPTNIGDLRGPGWKIHEYGQRAAFLDEQGTLPKVAVLEFWGYITVSCSVGVHGASARPPQTAPDKR